eukprot:Filipodium_phascolosomae@DN1452_c0_g1_i1.p1
MGGDLVSDFFKKKKKTLKQPAKSSKNEGVKTNEKTEWGGDDEELETEERVYAQTKAGKIASQILAVKAQEAQGNNVADSKVTAKTWGQPESGISATVVTNKREFPVLGVKPQETGAADLGILLGKQGNRFEALREVEQKDSESDDSDEEKDQEAKQKRSTAKSANKDNVMAILEKKTKSTAEEQSHNDVVQKDTIIDEALCQLKYSNRTKKRSAKMTERIM